MWLQKLYLPHATPTPDSSDLELCNRREIFNSDEETGRTLLQNRDGVWGPECKLCVDFVDRVQQHIWLRGEDRQGQQAGSQ